MTQFLTTEEVCTALRSGEFIQGCEVLCGDGEFCCLGVMSELACRKGLLQKLVDSISGDVKYMSLDGNRSSYVELIFEALPGINHCGDFCVDKLSKEGREYYKRLCQDQMMKERSENSLMYMNDMMVPFSKIADMIEFIVKAEAWSH